jgi:hypothetical protein
MKAPSLSSHAEPRMGAGHRMITLTATPPVMPETPSAAPNARGVTLLPCVASMPA